MNTIIRSILNLFTSARHKESFETELPKLPFRKVKSKIFRAATNLVSKRAKFNIVFESSGPLGKHLCVTRNCAYSILPDSP